MGRLTLHAIRLADRTQRAIEQVPAADSGGSETWLLITVALIGSSVLAGIITTVLTNLRATANQRREGYALAVRALIARAEYPYRVRRRVADTPDVLAALVGRGHDLQEDLAARRTWVRAESTRLGDLYDHALASIDATVSVATAEAWERGPASNPQAMNLNGWGPGDPWPHLVELQVGIGRRFGWRRVCPNGIWRVADELREKTRSVPKPARRSPPE